MGLELLSKVAARPYGGLYRLGSSKALPPPVYTDAQAVVELLPEKSKLKLNEAGHVAERKPILRFLGDRSGCCHCCSATPMPREGAGSASSTAWMRSRTSSRTVLLSAGRKQPGPI